jgi:K+-transporting ATPase ATPase A chain
MLLGRFVTIIAVLMLAGSLVANKRYVSGISYNSLSTTSWIFGVLVVFSILIVGGLTIFPALAIGPILDQLILISSI